MNAIAKGAVIGIGVYVAAMIVSVLGLVILNLLLSN